MKYLLFIPIFLATFWSAPIEDRIQVEIVTTHGTILLELYNETPLHRDNFIKLVQDGIYDSLLFHRVIEDFMIQAGDTKSKNAEPGARLGSSDLNYRVPAEILPSHFHKKGALGAARTGNPERASSSTQFYLVQGEIQSDSLLEHNQGRINKMLASHSAMNDPTTKPLLDSLKFARETKDSLQIKLLSDSLTSVRESYSNFERYVIPEAHRKVYQTIGGKPHLDQNYTVFGEIISGLEVVDSIAAVETGARDRPIEDVRILSMRLISR